MGFSGSGGSLSIIPFNQDIKNTILHMKIALFKHIEKQKLVNFVKGPVIETLKDFGLTAKQRNFKFILQKTGTISKQLRDHKAQTYRILANLRNKRLFESTFEVPMRFEAVSFKSFLDLMINSKKEEVTLLEEKRNELLDY